MFRGIVRASLPRRSVSSLTLTRTRNAASYVAATPQMSHRRQALLCGCLHRLMSTEATAAAAAAAAPDTKATPPPPAPKPLTMYGLFKELDMLEYLHRFGRERIEIGDLLKLSDEDLRELVGEMGPRSRLRHRLEQMDKDKIDVSDVSWTVPVHKLTMPDFVAGKEDSFIDKWYVQEGEAVKEGQTLCEIDNDLAIVEFESPETGILAAITRPAGPEKIEVGELIGLVCAEKDLDLARATLGLRPLENASEEQGEGNASAAATAATEGDATSGAKA